MHRLVFALFIALACHAQQTEGSISGLVTDSQGAPVPRVEITATQLSTGVRTTVHSNETGFYSLRPLPIGGYTLTAQLTGFRTAQQTNITLTTGQALELPIQLETGAVSESVTVTADIPLLESRTAEASQLIESKSIEDMPMGDRRALNIVEITGAAVFIRSETGASPTFSLAGGRAGSQMTWIDGGAGQNMRLGVPGSNVDPPIETLQEIKVMGNGFSAEFGASAGGVIIANTKSGTNRFHGSLFEYFRNQILDAPNFFSPIINGEKQRPALRYNVFGGTIGGPIRRDRTFFFFAYEGSRRGDGTVRTLTVPSLLERAGNFSETRTQRGLATIYDPSSGRLNGTAVVRDPFPGNVVPSNRFDPISAKLVPFFPSPNRGADDITGANNFRLNDVNRTRRHNITVKVDHMLSTSNKLTFRYLYNSDASVRSSVYPTPAADTINQSDGQTTFWYGTWMRVVSPNIINELRATYGSRSFHSYARGAGEKWPSRLGFNGVADDFFPNIAPAAYAALGASSQDRQQFPIKQGQIVESLSWIRGKHALKFGGEYRPSFNHEVLRATVSGRYVFSRGFTGAVGNAFTGNGFATMLLGIPTNFETRETDVLDRRSTYLAWFAQSDWNVSPALTVNVGVRWEADTPMVDTGNKMNSWDPTAINPVSGTPGVVRFLGLNGFRNTPYDPDWNNFAPRVGIAWKPLGLKKTVIRTGFGVFFAHPFDRAVPNVATLGFERSATLQLQDNSLTVPYTLSSGVPVPPARREQELNDAFGAVRQGINPTQAITYFEFNRRSGYSMQSSFRIQHELPGRMVVEYGYIGNLSRKLASRNMQTNQIRPELLRPGSSFRDRPFAQFSGVSIIAPSLGVSSYHAGMVKLEKRFAQGFNLLSTYTWSKFLDNVDAGSTFFGNEGAGFSDFYNRRLDWGPSELDLRHRVTASSVYQLPFGRGKKWLNDHWLGTIAGGWSVGSVLVLQSGGPVTVTTQTNTTFAFSSGAQRADILRNPNLPGGQRALNRWFDTTAFAQPASYTFGNQGLGHIRADGMVQYNCSIIRTFRFWEGKQLQFRGELLNAPNHPDFSTPGQVFEGPGFGIVNAARPGRQVQLGMRIVF